MLKNQKWTETTQTVRIQHGQLSRWWQCKEYLIIYLSLSKERANGFEKKQKT